MHVLCIPYYGNVAYWPTLQFYLSVYVSFVCRYVAPFGECCYNTVLCCDYLSLSSMVLVSRTFSALCVYSKFGHPHPLGYLCAKFRFVRGSIAELASPWRRIAYSINKSIRLFDAAGTEVCASESMMLRFDKSMYSCVLVELWERRKICQ